MTNKLVHHSLRVPKIKKILLYEMKFLVPNYSCLQNPWLGGYAPRSPFSLFSRQFVEPPPRKKFLGTPLQISERPSILSHPIPSYPILPYLIRTLSMPCCTLANQHTHAYSHTLARLYHFSTCCTVCGFGICLFFQQRCSCCQLRCTLQPISVAHWIHFGVFLHMILCVFSCRLADPLSRLPQYGYRALCTPLHLLPHAGTSILIFADVSGKPIGPVFKGSDRLSRNFGNELPLLAAQ